MTTQRKLSTVFVDGRAQQPVKVHHKTVKVGDLDIFYREAGPKDAPAILLLHGLPTGSKIFPTPFPVRGAR